MGFPSNRCILVSGSHPTKQLNEGKSFVATSGPGFRANGKQHRRVEGKYLQLQIEFFFDRKLSEHSERSEKKVPDSLPYCVCVKCFSTYMCICVFHPTSGHSAFQYKYQTATRVMFHKKNM